MNKFIRLNQQYAKNDNYYNKVVGCVSKGIPINVLPLHISSKLSQNLLPLIHKIS